MKPKDFNPNDSRSDEASAAFAAKEQGIKQVLENETKDAKQVIYETICHRARTGKPFTANDVRRDIGEQWFDDLHHPSVFSAVWSRAAGEKIIKKTGRYAPSKRKAAHGRDLPEWVGV